MSHSRWRPRIAHPRSFAIIAAFVASFLLLPLLPASAAQPRPTKAVAVQGDVAPGTGGLTFTHFDEPMINANDDVAFGASYSTLFGFGFFLRHEKVLSPVILLGQTTAEGTIGPFGFDGPALNSEGTVAVVANNITGGTTTAAVYRKKLGGPLVAIAKQGDAAPGVVGGTFVFFDDLAINNAGDIAFNATYTTDAGITTKTGVFLKQRGDPLVAILRNGDSLPGTGGTFCGTFNGDVALDGPWLNDNGVVTFQADCISGGAGTFTGSVFIKKPEQSSIQAFVKIGDPGPASTGGTITEIKTGRPGLNETQAVMLLTISSTTPEKVVVTKQLNGDQRVRVCATDQQSSPVGGGVISFNGDPTIAGNGTIGMAVTVGLTDNTDAIFTCKEKEISAIVLQGDPKPVGTGNTYGSVEESSNATGHVVFLDEGATLRGVYESVDR